MYLGLILVLNASIFALCMAQLIPQGNWLFLAGLVFSTAMVTFVMPHIKPHND